MWVTPNRYDSGHISTTTSTGEALTCPADRPITALHCLPNRPEPAL